MRISPQEMNLSQVPGCTLTSIRTLILKQTFKGSCIKTLSTKIKSKLKSSRLFA